MKMPIILEKHIYFAFLVNLEIGKFAKIYKKNVVQFFLLFFTSFCLLLVNLKKTCFMREKNTYFTQTSIHGPKKINNIQKLYYLCTTRNQYET